MILLFVAEKVYNRSLGILVLTNFSRVLIFAGAYSIRPFRSAALAECSVVINVSYFVVRRA